MRYWRVPIVMLYLPPLEAVYSVPNFQAHLSAFSWPRVSYQAFRSGSEEASSNSWEMMDAMPSAPALPLGAVCIEQDDGQRSGLPTKLYLMSAPLMVPWSCQPQKLPQKVEVPEVSDTSDDVSTKYTALVFAA